MYLKPANFYPISHNWITINVYSGYFFLDRLLTQLKPYIFNLLEEDLIASFFYIRYNDPDPHLRIRFYLTDLTRINILFEILNTQLNDAIKLHIVWRITITGYKREMSRYGLLSIELVEEIFFISSIFIIEKLQTYKDRVKLSLIVFNALLNSINYDLNQKSQLCRKIKEGFMSEYNFTKEVKKELGKKAKIYEEQFATALEHLEDDDYKGLKDSLRYSCGKLRGIFNFYSKDHVFTIVSSLLHMNFNRIFINNARKNEAIVYYVLDRYYTKLLCRQY